MNGSVCCYEEEEQCTSTTTTAPVAEELPAYDFVTVEVDEYKETPSHDSIRAGAAAAITYDDKEYPISSTISGNTDNSSCSGLATPPTTRNAATKTVVISDSADVAEEEGPAPPSASSSAASTSSSLFSRRMSALLPNCWVQLKLPVNNIFHSRSIVCFVVHHTILVYSHNYSVFLLRISNMSISTCVPDSICIECTSQKLIIKWGSG